MAENKKSFILYCDIVKTVEKLPNEVAGELFKHLLDYVNDKDPKTDNLLVEIAFEPIKQQLKRDLEKYEGSKVSRSDNGKLGNLKRWNKDLYDKVVSKKITIKEAKDIANSRKSSHSDKTNRTPSQEVANVAVNDTVTVTVNDNDINISLLEEKVSKVIDRFKETNYDAKERSFKTDKENLIIRLEEFLEENKLNDEFKNKQYGPVITWFWRWLNYNKPKEVVKKSAAPWLGNN
jgi:hypothetical protein